LLVQRPLMPFTVPSVGSAIVPTFFPSGEKICTCDVALCR
jgi:hypothetical protein